MYHKNDILLGTGLLITALCLFLVLQIFQTKDGGSVQVKQGGRVIATYSLEKDATYGIKSLSGSNTLIIKDREAYMSESTCSDHICESMGKISKVGESIICLPNELIITVISGETSTVDAMVQ